MDLESLQHLRWKLFDNSWQLVVSYYQIEVHLRRCCKPRYVSDSDSTHSSFFYEYDVRLKTSHYIFTVRKRSIIQIQQEVPQHRFFVRQKNKRFKDIEIQPGGLGCANEHKTAKKTKFFCLDGV